MDDFQISFIDEFREIEIEVLDFLDSSRTLRVSTGPAYKKDLIRFSKTRYENWERLMRWNAKS